MCPQQTRSGSPFSLPRKHSWLQGSAQCLSEESRAARSSSASLPGAPGLPPPGQTCRGHAAQPGGALPSLRLGSHRDQHSCELLTTGEDGWPDPQLAYLPAWPSPATPSGRSLLVLAEGQLTLLEPFLPEARRTQASTPEKLQSWGSSSKVEKWRCHKFQQLICWVPGLVCMVLVCKFDLFEP